MPDYTVSALQDGIAILKVLMEAFEALTQKELADRTGFPANKIYRYLWNFEQHGWVEPVTIEGAECYRLGYALMTLTPRAIRAMEDINE